jgi:long-chain-fatty-acid--CoA ligase ACSBG
MPGVEVCAFKVDDRDLNKKVACPRSPALDALDDQYQGELCFRGRNIMMGYLANPDLGDAHVKEIEKKTAEAIDREGWLHSGDKGMITTTGMVKITGRYKELIIGDGGENIAPVPIEDHVKKSCDGIAEVMMVGDKRKYNVALVTLKAVGANGEVPGTDDLDAGAKRVNPEVTTISGAMKDSVWIEAISAAIKSANDNGKVCPNNAFKIQKFTILPQNFSEENNELTPTKKLKRAVVATKYTELIEKLYSSDGMYIPYQ